MEHAEESIKEYLSKQANLVDESNVEALLDDASLAAGKTVYEGKCAACHGMAGEGGVGPNLTDEYWLHGGDIKSVFKTIKYGVPEKGMISWKSQLRPAEMHKTASYILTLVGTNPPNGKEPQGEKLQVENTMPTDSTALDLSMN
jgi:cytochrome c oxidase cbb3-type subunit 3